jgi:hypothetical protein
MNPAGASAVNEEFADKIREDEGISEAEKERILEMASLMNNSQVLKSYEQLIQQYEVEFEQKNERIRDIERELHLIQLDNSNLSQQLYSIKAQHASSLGAKDEPVPTGIDPAMVFTNQERDKLVEMLKRNHDIIVEKYETQRERLEMLEKTAFDKERLYNEIKGDNDLIANSNYKLIRGNEDLKNQIKIQEQKWKNSDT